MNNALLIQCTSGPAYAQHLALYYGRHVNYCIDHEFDYWTNSGPIRFQEHPAWNKFALALQAFAMGYTYVVLMDTDAFVYNLQVDLRDACIKPMNLARWTQPMSHLQAGVIYLNNATDISRALLTHLIEESKYYLEIRSTLRGWFEQGQINQLANDNPGIGKHIGEISLQWNWCRKSCKQVYDPYVISWHGVPDPERFNLMQDELLALSAVEK